MKGTDGHRELKQRKEVRDNMDGIRSFSIFGCKVFKGYKGGELELTSAYLSHHCIPVPPCRRKAEGMPTEGEVSKKMQKDSSTFRKLNSLMYPS